jgi:prepilin-type N-terminal cleavage/methylation domain-containing protein
MLLKDRRPWDRRPGFTLLELILALAIGMLLLAGLYFALDVHFRTADVGRTEVDQSLVARGVVKWIAGDINGNLSTMPNPGNSNAASSTTGTGTGTSTANNTTTTTSGVVNGTYKFNLGVQGTADRLTLYISKVPLALTAPPDADGNPAGDTVIDSDLRRISYWVVGAGTDKPSGLARQEIKWVTNDDDINALPPGIADEDKLVIAPEVLAVQFDYWDAPNQRWAQEWDGTALATDGVTPVGPPMAIKITLWINTPDLKATDKDDPNVLVVEHVVQIPTAVAGLPDTSSTNSPPP